VVAEGFGASEAGLTVVRRVCVGAEVAGSAGPSEKLLPSWPVGGASTTTGEQQQCCKYCGYYGILHRKLGRQ